MRADGFHGSVAVDGAAKFVAGEAESDFGTIMELDGVGPSESTYQVGGGQLANDFVIAIHFVLSLDILQKKIGDRWMMAGVLTVVLGPIVELTLQCFSQKRIEWFILTTAEVYAAHCESDHQFESF